MLEERAEEAPIEIGAIARPANGDARRTAGGLRVADGTAATAPAASSAAGPAEAGEKIATVASHLNRRGAKSLNARRQLSHSCAVPGDSK